jgi:hypothetical protein
MRPLALAFPLACVAVIATAVAAAAPPSSGPVSLTRREAALHRPDDLKPVSAFASISDPKMRSVAIFQEVGKVIQHPRCVNCHPVDGRPRQGMDGHPHNPPMQGGEAGMGVAGLKCTACHGPANFKVGGVDTRSIPGNPKWALAPAEMAWQGRSLGDICRQIKDPARNHGKSLAELHDHMANDPLVGWGWAPGEGRAPVPGTQQRFGELIRAWIDTGAVCPA